MKTVIILAPVNSSVGRHDLEKIENVIFKDKEHIRLHFPDGNVVFVYDITDFMDAFNNEEIEQSDFFLGYVRVRK